MKSRDFYLPIQDVFVLSLRRFQETNEFLEQPILVALVNEELRDKHFFLKLLKRIKLKNLIIHTTERHCSTKCFSTYVFFAFNCFRQCNNTTN